MAVQGDFGHRLEILRRMELEAYQSAYYIVQDERKAVEIAKAAMLDFGRNINPFQAGDADTRKLLRRAVMKCSLPLIQGQL